VRELAVLTYGTVTETAVGEARADFDAWLEDKPLPSVQREQAEKIQTRRLEVANLQNVAKML
jgi:hypothetical protein